MTWHSESRGVCYNCGGTQMSQNTPTWPQKHGYNSKSWQVWVTSIGTICSSFIDSTQVITRHRYNNNSTVTTLFLRSKEYQINSYRWRQTFAKSDDEHFAIAVYRARTSFEPWPNTVLRRGLKIAERRLFLCPCIPLARVKNRSNVIAEDQALKLDMHYKLIRFSIN